MNKKGIVEINLRSGARRTVEAFIAGVFAYHRRDGEPREKLWAVTHSPSGLAVSTQLTYKGARQLAVALMKDPFWGALVLDGKGAFKSMRARKEAKARRDKALAELGL